MRHAQSPGIAFLRYHLQAYLILARRVVLVRRGFNHQFGPHHGELDAAFAEEDDQRIERFQFAANRTQAHAGGCEVERMHQRFELRARRFFSSYPHRQHAGNTSLTASGYFWSG